MNSMTGYGASSQEFDACRVSVRMRSVNHRFLDLVIRMPEELRHLELATRQQLSERLLRGRIEVRIDVEDRGQRPVDIHLNRSWISALQKVAADLEQENLVTQNLGLRDLLRFPDALRLTPQPGATDAEIADAVSSTVISALDDLQLSRHEEGEKLGSALLQLLDSLEALVQEIDGAQEKVRAELENRLRQRLEELLSRSPDLAETRIEQELAILVERSDIREELDRLAAHLEQFRSSMSGEPPIGKKLDFLAQEILRELSTVGAKCRQAGVIQRHVDAKLICEQIREQVQNIE
jgi:uncharacterized protein (TIGR00255 family)